MVGCLVLPEVINTQKGFAGYDKVEAFDKMVGLG